MDVDIITISDTVDRLSSRIKSTFEGFRGKYYSTYGDVGRVPEEYIKTDTLKKFFVGIIESNPSKYSKKYYEDFPQLSQILLKNLFSEIGVSYVPEILLYQQKTTNEPPYEIFKKFCTTFTPKASKVESEVINQVILTLKEMDTCRVKYPFYSKPIYFQLSLQNFEQADELICMMQDTLSFLEKLESMNSELLDEARKEFLKQWNAPYAIKYFKQKYNLN